MRAILCLALLLVAPWAASAQSAMKNCGLSVDVGGTARSYCTLQSSSYSAAAGSVPLIVHLCDAGQTAIDAAEELWSALAETNNFIVAVPEPQAATWNFGSSVAGAPTSADQEMVLALITKVKNDFAISADRVHITGFGDGGSMAFRVACAAGSGVGSIGVVSGGLSETVSQACEAPNPFSVVYFASTNDAKYPFTAVTEAVDGIFTSVVTDLFWESRGGCCASRPPDNGSGGGSEPPPDTEPSNPGGRRAHGEAEAEEGAEAPAKRPSLGTERWDAGAGAVGGDVAAGDAAWEAKFVPDAASGHGRFLQGTSGSGPTSADGSAPPPPSGSGSQPPDPCGDTFPADVAVPDADPNDGSTITYRVPTGCMDKVNVRMYVVENGGHFWPGSLAPGANKDLDASATIWTFLQANPLVDGSGGSQACDDKICNGHGTCMGPDLCTCEDGWEGDLCTTQITPCTNAYCGEAGHGSCVVFNVTDYRCVCTADWRGGDCMIPVWQNAIDQLNSFGNLANSIFAVFDKDVGSGPAKRIVRGASTDSTVIKLADATRWVVASAIVKLIEAGTLSADDLVSKHVTWWTTSSADHRSRVTLKMLLSNTAGFDNTGAACADPSSGSSVTSLELCARAIYDAAQTIPYGPPGTQFYYSDAHYAVAGLVALKASGKSTFKQLVGDTLGTALTGGLTSLVFAPSDAMPSLSRGLSMAAGDYLKWFEAYYRKTLHTAAGYALLEGDYTPDGSVRLAYSPLLADAPYVAAHYGFGNFLYIGTGEWIPTASTYQERMQPGALGVYNFLDRTRDFAVVILAELDTPDMSGVMSWGQNLIAVTAEALDIPLRADPCNAGANECSGHGTCFSPWGCLCSFEYSGTDCDKEVVDPCAGITCNAKGSCMPISDTDYYCSCLAGWTGAGCDTELDVCKDVQCDRGSCVAGTCACPSGYGGEKCELTCPFGYEGRTCQDLVDNCAPPAYCDNGGICINGVGYYNCSCGLGYSGKHCENTIDFCAGNQCTNGATCEANSGGDVRQYVCRCAPGYSGDFCGVNDLDFCSRMACQNGANCTNQQNNGVCDCALGYTGQFCENEVNECVVLDTPCKNGATCVDKVNDFQCQCAMGWEGKACDQMINMCQVLADPPCQNGATCTPLLNDYKCECVTGWDGKNCEFSADDPCRNEPCFNGATCKRVGDTTDFTCDCKPGFTGDVCRDNIDDCAPNPYACHNGTCIDGANKYTCECFPGYSGPACLQNVDDCAKDSVVCQNGGHCVDGANSWTCVCPKGFGGDYCETNLPDCLGNPCEHGGTCVDKVAAFDCQCTLGWTGKTCGESVNDCAGINPCKNGGSCVDGDNSYSCDCALGWTGDDCSTQINECDFDPCENGADCIDGQGDYSCVCTFGWTGKACNININECAVYSPCKNGAACVDNDQGFVCQCEPGWIGKLCDEDVKDCDKLPCQNGATCVEGIGGEANYTCTCPPGYGDPWCGTEIDECANRPCQNQGFCVDKVNDYLCNCRAAFTGRHCEVDIDECSPNPCENGGECTDYKGREGHMCKCATGFSGTRCQTDIDECALQPCKNGGKCTQGRGYRNCTCVDNFSGNDCGVDPCELTYCKSGKCIETGPQHGACNCTDGYTGLQCDVAPAVDSGSGSTAGPASDCSNGKMDGDETDIDCGGTAVGCPQCPAGFACKSNDNCAAGSVCTEQSDGSVCTDDRLGTKVTYVEGTVVLAGMTKAQFTGTHAESFKASLAQATNQHLPNGAKLLSASDVIIMELIEVQLPSRWLMRLLAEAQVELKVTFRILVAEGADAQDVSNAVSGAVADTGSTGLGARMQSNNLAPAGSVHLTAVPTSATTSGAPLKVIAKPVSGGSSSAGQQTGGSSPDAPEKDGGGVPVVGVVFIVLIVLIGGVAVWKARQSASKTKFFSADSDSDGEEEVILAQHEGGAPVTHMRLGSGPASGTTRTGLAAARAARASRASRASVEMSAVMPSYGAAARAQGPAGGASGAGAGSMGGAKRGGAPAGPPPARNAAAASRRDRMRRMSQHTPGAPGAAGVPPPAGGPGGRPSGSRPGDASVMHSNPLAGMHGGGAAAAGPAPAAAAGWPGPRGAGAPPSTGLLPPPPPPDSPPPSSSDEE